MGVASGRSFNCRYMTGRVSSVRYVQLLTLARMIRVLPFAWARTLNVVSIGGDYRLRWRGSAYTLRFGETTLELGTDEAWCRWRAIVGFSTAPIPFALLGQAGCLQYFDVTFRGADRIVDFEPNDTFPGETQLTVKS